MARGTEELWESKGRVIPRPLPQPLGRRSTGRCGHRRARPPNEGCWPLSGSGAGLQLGGGGGAALPRDAEAGAPRPPGGPLPCLPPAWGWLTAVAPNRGQHGSGQPRDPGASGLTPAQKGCERRGPSILLTPSLAPCCPASPRPSLCPLGTQTLITSTLWVEPWGPLLCPGTPAPAHTSPPGLPDHGRAPCTPRDTSLSPASARPGT